jgi:hypothetical protein
MMLMHDVNPFELLMYHSRREVNKLNAYEGQLSRQNQQSMPKSLGRSDFYSEVGDDSVSMMYMYIYL